MADIVLVALNAKYIHASFGLRYIYTSLAELQPRAVIREFIAQTRPIDVLEQILEERPKVIAIGVYIWNVDAVRELVTLLRRVAPEVAIVLGGPEISHETEMQPLASIVDYVVRGEAEDTFRELTTELLAGRPPRERIVDAALPNLDLLPLPYDAYSDEDIAHRVVYVEASRGCPFRCEFCLSSLDEKVRTIPLDRFLAAMARLHERGVRHFKFVDRTFNLDLKRCVEILEFFAARVTDDLLVHFEMVPDRLPDGLRAVIERFPPGVLQFEVGVQTYDEEVSARIDRRRSADQIDANLRWLRESTGVHVHADLIVGLPGESVEMFGRGFDRLWRARPHEIQMGILKRLRGAPVARHDVEWGMVYEPEAPYEIIQTGLVSFGELQEMRRFARFWDMIANSGHFLTVLPMLLDGDSPFAAFRELSRRLHERFEAVHGIAAPKLTRAIMDEAVRRGRSEEEVGSGLVVGWLRSGRTQLPEFLRPYLDEDQRRWIREQRGRRGASKRQQAHR